MQDDSGLEEALCALTALNDEQLAGLKRLATWGADDVARFAEQVDSAWEANRQAVQDVKQQIRRARQEQARTETECGEAARRRYLAAGGIGLCVLNEQERERATAARAEVDAAREALSSVQARFKAGVTAEQLGSN